MPRSRSASRQCNRSRSASRTRDRSRSASRKRDPLRWRDRESLSKYPPRRLRGSRARRAVYNGKYDYTRGGLDFDDITKNPYGRLVSRIRQFNGKELQKNYPYEKNRAFLHNLGQIQRIRQGLPVKTPARFSRSPQKSRSRRSHSRKQHRRRR